MVGVPFDVEELSDLPPQPATARVAARTASSVSMAVSGVRFMGWTPTVARGLRRSPYQALATPIAAGAVDVSVETAARPPLLSPGSEPGAGGGRSPRVGWLLAVCCVAQFMVILDLSIVNVALPSIQGALEFTPPELQWVVDAYAITFAGFLMLGGRAADHFGQRRTFVAALVVFGLTSLVGGLATSREMLIFARAAQGVGGALMAACSLAIITSSFTPGPQLNRAIGMWAATNGLGGAAGALFGGVITQELTWRWILLINPPIAIVAAAVAWTVVAERVRDRERSFDLAGAITLTAGQMVLVYGVVEAGLAGWSSPKALGPIGGGIALLVVFGLIEARLASEPLIPFKELTKPLRDANNIVLLFSAALFPMWFVSSLYLQQVLGLSPLHTGLIFLPMTLMILLVAPRSGKLVGHFGVRTVLGAGLVMLCAGLLLMARIGPSGSGVIYIMIPGLLTAAGIAMSIVPSTIAATQGAKPGQTGLASGLVNTSRQIGGGLGLAVLITLATQHSTHLIGLGYGVPQALTHGFRLAYLIGAGLAGAAALLTFVALPRPDAALARAVRLFAVSIGAVVAVFAGVVFAFAGSHGAPIGAYRLQGSYSFVTEPGMHPPIIRKTQATTGKLAPGYIFTADFYDLSEPPMIGQSGPLILDRNLQPVWFQPVPESVVAANLSLQSYEGKPVLAWWQGFVTNTGATESGEERRRQPALPDCREAEGERRLGPDAPRVHRRRRRRLGDGQQEHSPRPLRRGRRLQRRADRLRCAGVQPQDRQAPLHVGRARSHPAGRLLRLAAHQRLSLGRLPRQLAAARRLRTLPGLDAQHVGRVPCGHQDRAHRMGARRAPLELQVRPRSGLPVAARRAHAEPDDDHDVRRPLLPDHRRGHLCTPDRAFAGTGTAARRHDSHGDAARTVPARTGLRQ